jgi:hypothetical protein
MAVLGLFLFLAVTALNVLQISGQAVCQRRHVTCLAGIVKRRSDGKLNRNSIS